MPTTPDFIGLAGHPVRWGLLTELSRSDRHVNELTRLLDQPQALVSYHLARLRDGGLVSSRKSNHDRRASYYSIDLRGCGEAIAATGTSLHPGLALRLVTPDAPTRRMARPVAVLFACTGNSARSQIAEALLRTRAGDQFDVASGGSVPKPIHPNAIRVLAERGIDISASTSKPLTQFEGRHFDVVVTLCDKAREVCPQFSPAARSIHWSLEEPATYHAFRALAAEIDTRIGFLIALINTPDTEVSKHARH